MCCLKVYGCKVDTDYNFLTIGIHHISCVSGASLVFEFSRAAQAFEILFLVLSPPWNESFGRKRRFYQNLNLAISVDISCSTVITEHSLAENGFPELTKHYFHNCYLI